jgi:hypothetical protein
MEEIMRIAAAVVGILFAANSWAQCQLNPRTDLTGPATPGVPFTISWDAVPEGTTVEVRKGTLATGSNVLNPYLFGTSSSRFVRGANSVQDTIFTNARGYVNYQVVAFGPDGVLCSAPLNVIVMNSAATRSLFERVIIPVAGSITGAHGAQFKTSLTLTVPASASATTYTGRIIFHPAGATASDDDPSMPYTITAEGSGAKVVEIDDVVGQMGRTGLGTIDIVPSINSRGLVPFVTARVYTPEQIDTFTGTESAATMPEDGVFLEPNRLQMMQFVLPDASRYRASIGVRTVGSDPILMNVVISPQGAPQWNTQVFLAPNTFQHLALETITGYKPVGGESVTVMFRGGAANPTGMTAVLPYYTITNNVTNDLQIFVGAHRINPTDVTGTFIE